MVYSPKELVGFIDGPAEVFLSYVAGVLWYMLLVIG